MTPVTGFPVFLGLTLAALACVFWTGLRARRKQHIPLVVLTIGLLAMTIMYAERLGEGLDLEAAGWIYPVHLAIAIFTTVAYLVPVTTGILTLRRPRLRRWHGRIAWTVLGLTVLTAATGIWMVMAAPVR